MAFVDTVKVHTNLSDDEFAKVKAALQTKGQPDIKWGQLSLYVGDRICEFEYLGERYMIHEDFEIVDRLIKI